MADAKVSILDRGFLFADGIYEVAAVLDGKLIDNASHLARLQRSVGEIALALPEAIDRIQEIQKELIARNNLVDGMVYLEVTRGADTGRDFAFPKGVKPTLIMFTSVKDIVNAASAKAGIGVITVPDIRWARRDIKSVALLAQVLANDRPFTPDLHRFRPRQCGVNSSAWAWRNNRQNRIIARTKAPPPIVLFTAPH